MIFKAKSIIFILLISNFLLGKTDSTEVISFEYTNFEEVANRSGLIYLTAQEWSFGGALISNGLPGFASEYRYNGFNARDPLYGNTVHAWMNPRYTNILIADNGMIINQQPMYNSQKDLYSRFDWYRGDYNYGIFGAMLSGIINNEYSYSFYGEDFRYAGSSNGYTSNYSNPNKSISQNFALDIKKSSKSYEISSGFNYKKYSAGNISFSNDYLQFPGYDGYSKKYKRQLYLKVEMPSDSDSLIIGGQLTNYNYGYFPNKTANNLKGQGNSNTIFATNYRFFQNDSVFLDVAYDNNNVYLESQNDYLSSILKLTLGSYGEKFNIDYHFSVNTKNENVGFDLGLKKGITSKFYLGINSTFNYYQYPYIYKLFPAFQNTPEVIDEFEPYSQNELSLNYNNKFLAIRTSVDYTSSDFYRPYQTAIDDSVYNFKKINLKDIFWNTQISIDLPWKTTLYSNIKYSPTVNRDEFYHFQYFGSIEQKLVLFKGNLNLYARGSVTYFAGGEKVNWYDEFQTIGMIDTDYYTNEKLCFSAKFGFKVGSLHMFYQLHNLEARDFANAQSMLLQTPLNILGIEWYFFN